MEVYLGLFMSLHLILKNPSCCFLYLTANPKVTQAANWNQKMQEECNGTVLKAMPVTGVQLSHQFFPIRNIQSIEAQEKKRLLRSINYSF